ncbi:hypothetical protein D3C72_1476130 [compost metagenome]
MPVSVAGSNVQPCGTTMSVAVYAIGVAALKMLVVLAGSGLSVVTVNWTLTGVPYTTGSVDTMGHRVPAGAPAAQ